MVRLTILATSNGTEPCIDELEVYTTAESGWISATKRRAGLGRREGVGVVGVPGRARSTRSLISTTAGTATAGAGSRESPGKGVVTIAWPEPATIDRVVWGRDREGAYRDRLATEYYLEAALEPGRWQVVASSLDRQAYRSDAPSTESPASPGSALETAELRSTTGRAPRSARRNWARR